MSRIQMLDGWRGLVPSDTLGQPPYLIDLVLFDGNGKCTCKDFECRCLPKLKAGEKISERTRCKHIRALRSHCMNLVINRYNLETKKSLNGKKVDEGE